MYSHALITKSSGSAAEKYSPSHVTSSEKFVGFGKFADPKNRGTSTLAVETRLYTSI